MASQLASKKEKRRMVSGQTNLPHSRESERMENDQLTVSSAQLPIIDHQS